MRRSIVTTSALLAGAIAAVGCAQKVFVEDGKVTQIEGNPASPISRGRLCPKGSASKQLVTSPTRVTTVRYRRPYGTEWEDLDLDTAVDMIADRIPAMASPATAPGVKWSRNSGAASSGSESGASLPCATSAGTARPIPSQISRQRIWENPRVNGSQRSFRGSFSM